MFNVDPRLILNALDLLLLDRIEMESTENPFFVLWLLSMIKKNREICQDRRGRKLAYKSVVESRPTLDFIAKWFMSLIKKPVKPSQ